MKKYLAFVIIVMVAINGMLAAPRSDDQAVCSPWLGLCQLTEQCCRDLLCHGYLAKCVPGKIYPDNRPIGDGPFPPTRAPLNDDMLGSENELKDE